MRNIRFRAFHRKEKKMYMVTSIDWTWNGELIFYIAVQFKKESPTETRASDWKEFELMEYTGLKDKNGKEIFEGDVLVKNPQYKFQVIWKSDWGKYCLQAFLRRNKRVVLMSIQQAPRMEIIGNLYENPELVQA